MVCTAPEGSPWNGLQSDLENWRAYGVAVPGTQTYNSLNEGAVPCQSSSGFSMSGSGTATKIWASTGQPEARFETTPQGNC